VESLTSCMNAVDHLRDLHTSRCRLIFQIYSMVLYWALRSYISEES
jgi:hypothetical protein